MKRFFGVLAGFLVLGVGVLVLAEDSLPLWRLWARIPPPLAWAESSSPPLSWPEGSARGGIGQKKKSRPSAGPVTIRRGADYIEEERRFVVRGVARFEGSNISGDLQVRRHGGKEIVLRYRLCLRPKGKPYRKLHLKQQGNRVQLKLEKKERSGLTSGPLHLSPRCGYFVTARVLVPAKTTVSLHSVSGNVSSSDVGGLARLRTVSGRAQVRGASKAFVRSVSGEVRAKQVGSARLHTVSGAVFLQQGRGDFDLKTVSGQIQATQLGRVRRMKVKSVSGDLLLRQGQIERLQAASHSGSLTLEQASLGKSWQLRTFSGTVRLSLRAPGGFQLKAYSRSGDIRCALPLQQRHSDRFRLEGTYKAGKGRLLLKSFSGDLLVGGLRRSPGK